MNEKPKKPLGIRVLGGPFAIQGQPFALTVTRSFPIIRGEWTQRLEPSGQGKQGSEDTGMGSATSLLWGLFFGSFGLGYFVYGKRQQRMIPLGTGLALMIFPYFVSDTFLLVATGVFLLLLPYFWRED